MKLAFSLKVKILLESDKDWKKERVSFVKEKTGNPIVLPLLPHVGNSLFDYIRHERDNEAGSVYLFPNKKNATERLRCV